MEKRFKIADCLSNPEFIGVQGKKVEIEGGIVIIDDKGVQYVLKYPSEREGNSSTHQPPIVYWNVEEVEYPYYEHFTRLVNAFYRPLISSTEPVGFFLPNFSELVCAERYLEVREGDWEIMTFDGVGMGRWGMTDSEVVAFTQDLEIGQRQSEWMHSEYLQRKEIRAGKLVDKLKWLGKREEIVGVDGTCLGWLGVINVDFPTKFLQKEAGLAGKLGRKINEDTLKNELNQENAGSSSEFSELQAIVFLSADESLSVLSVFSHREEQSVKMAQEDLIRVGSGILSLSRVLPAYLESKKE